MEDYKDFLPLCTKFNTLAVHAGEFPDKWSHKSVVTPIVCSTNFKLPDPTGTEEGGYLYTRCGNPTRSALEKCIAALENAKYGLAFPSGLAATDAVIKLLRPGDHVIAGDCLYGGTVGAFREHAEPMNIDVAYVDTSDVRNVENAVQKNTKLVWIETPTNPTLKVSDLKAIATITKKHNILFVVDNSFLTCYLQRPLDFGVDISMSSVTKYMGGHNDVLMGATALNDEKLYKKLKYIQNLGGLIPSSHDCYQVLRSLKTLPLRMCQHMKNGLIIAKFLENHPKIEKVIHPGRPSHPQYEVTKKQTSGHSGMVGFYIKGNYDDSKKFVKSLKLIISAGSLGGAESVILIPKMISHDKISPEILNQLGITDNYMRLSVGTECAEDIIEDLKQALDNI